MTNAVKKLPLEARLKIAHNALTKRKPKISIEDYEDRGAVISVSYYDEANKEQFFDEEIHRGDLIDFTLDFYSTTHDDQINGEHIQYQDSRSVEYYLDENLKSVLKDFLINRRIPS